MKPAFEVAHRDGVGDDEVEFQPAAEEQVFHLVPGFEHPPAVDAQDRRAFEDDVVGQVERDGLGGQA